MAALFTAALAHRLFEAGVACFFDDRRDSLQRARFLWRAWRVAVVEHAVFVNPTDNVLQREDMNDESLMTF